MNTNTDIELAISQTRIRMLTFKKAAFFAYLSMRLPLIVNNDIPTACTDGYSIWINKDFFLNLTNEERVFLLFHETLHVALQHATRKGNRDFQTWVVAADYVINASLLDYGLPMPKQGLYDSRYTNMTTERVYELIKGQNINPDYDDLIIQSSSSENQEDKKQDNPENKSLSKPSSGLSPREIEEKIKEELIKAQLTVEISEGKQANDLPADIKRFFDQLQKPKLPWTTILSRFLHSRDKSNFSFRKPNRRFHSQGVYLPSRITDGLSRVDFVIDTSGSISKKDFTAFLSEVNAVLKQFKPKEIGLSQFDSIHYGTTVINKYTDLYKVVFKGGGGTCIRDTLKALKDVNTECLLILTDGYISDLYHSVTKKPVIWLIYENPDFKAPYGKVVHFERKHLR